MRTLDIFLYRLMKTVEIFRFNLFGLDAYLVRPEENKKSPLLNTNIELHPDIFQELKCKYNIGSKKHCTKPPTQKPNPSAAKKEKKRTSRNSTGSG